MLQVRVMVRRFIGLFSQAMGDLYGFDGFRFDLMGILDIKLNELARRAKKRAAKCHISTEKAGGKMATGLESDLLAHQYNAAELTDYGFSAIISVIPSKETILNKQRLTEWTSMANI